MKIFRFLIFALFFFSISGFIIGQNLKENELVVIQGEKFILHQVRTGETVYSISRDFKVDSSVLQKYNPNISEGLNIGEILKIPLNENVRLSEIQDLKKGEPTSFATHAIESNNETAYSISKRYGITVEDIYNYNPTVQRLRKGMILKIPQWGLIQISEPVEVQQLQTSVTGQEQKDMLEHTIASGETMFGITRKYQVSEEDLKAVNPDLKTGFRAGTVIRVPVNVNAVFQEQTDSNPDTGENQKPVSEVGLPVKVPAQCAQHSGITNGRNTVVALFLPLFLEANEQLNKEFISKEPLPVDLYKTEGEHATDTVIEVEKPAQLLKQFYGNSENFLQFYEGVLIAVDSMQKAGMKITLNVFDTKDNPETVRKIINNESFSETDLIIGPVYENVQKDIAQFAAFNQIPIVSPFTPKSEIINSNPYFYQINPTREYIAEATAQMIAEDFSGANFIVVKTSAFEGAQEGHLVNLVRRKLAAQGNSGNGKFTEYDFRKGRSKGLREILLPDRENVVLIPSSDEGELSVAISNINNLAVEFPVTLIGAGNYQQRYPSIEVSHYHNLKMKYINPYWIDYQKNSTIKYVEKFIGNFGTDPNSYGIQGFDAAWYFLNAIWFYGKDFEKCLPYLKVSLAQGTYYFKKVSPSGGYMNHGVSVISYNKNFGVERQRVIGQP